MKTRIALTMILTLTIVSGFLTGCGEKEVSAKEPSTKAEQLSITDNGKNEEIATDNVTINVSADKGWNTDSTPAILHVTSKDVEDVEFCHAITPDTDGGKGTTTVTLAEGAYDVEFISPLNHDGSAYEIYDMGASQEITVKGGNDMTVDCEMKQIPAEQVTDEMIQDIVTKIHAAVAKGDETLKGDAGKEALVKLAANVQNSPNASEKTKEMAETVKENTDTETKPEGTAKTDISAEKTEAAENTVQNNDVQGNAAVNNSQDNASVNSNTQNNTAVNNNTQNNTAVNNNTQNNTTVNKNQCNTQNNTQDAATVQPTQPAAPAVTEPETSAHVHTWANHEVTEWVPGTEMRDVPILVKDVRPEFADDDVVWVCNCGEIIPISECESHSVAHALADEPTNGFTTTGDGQIGIRTEEFQIEVRQTREDYRYCTVCGVKELY